MKIFGHVCEGSVALVRDDGKLFVGYSRSLPDGPVSTENLVRAAGAVRDVEEFHKTLSSTAGRAINAALAAALAGK